MIASAEEWSDKLKEDLSTLQEDERQFVEITKKAVEYYFSCFRNDKNNPNNYEELVKKLQEIKTNSINTKIYNIRRVVSDKYEERKSGLRKVDSQTRYSLEDIFTSLNKLNKFAQHFENTAEDLSTKIKSLIQIRKEIDSMFSHLYFATVDNITTQLIDEMKVKSAELTLD